MQAHDHEASTACDQNPRADTRVDGAAQIGAAKKRQALERPGGNEYQHPGARNPRYCPKDNPMHELVFQAHCKSREANDEKPGSNCDGGPDSHADR